ncbi:phage antirepressor KilAC domain-containing protein [Pasteurella multocida]
MNQKQLLNISNEKATLTMTSREIADLVETRHDSVKRTIERLSARGVIVRPPLVDEPIADMWGRSRTELVYQIGKRDSYVIVAQVCPEFTARLVDRWQELEQKNSVDVLALLNDPVYLRNALVNFSEKLIALTPKADAFDRLVTESEGSMNLTNAAKHLQVQPKILTQFLSSKRWIYKRINSKSWIAYQDKIQAGYLEHKANQYEDRSGVTKISEQVLVTAKGLAKVAELLNGAARL